MSKKILKNVEMQSFKKRRTWKGRYKYHFLISMSTKDRIRKKYVGERALEFRKLQFYMFRKKEHFYQWKQTFLSPGSFNGTCVRSRMTVTSARDGVRTGWPPRVVSWPFLNSCAPWSVTVEGTAKWLSGLGTWRWVTDSETGRSHYFTTHVLPGKTLIISRG